ncbi:unnamed protein product [Leptosia nina]|uniref:Uncharacterized protein n=1 Tax=Leptosia nina TaxID=320188 RepID=A0AAV1JZE7_9NEOP
MAATDMVTPLQCPPKASCCTKIKVMCNTLLFTNTSLLYSNINLCTTPHPYNTRIIIFNAVVHREGHASHAVPVHH